MSRDIRVSVKRKDALVNGLLNVPARIENISLVVIAGSGGAIPYNSFTFYSLEGVPDIKQGDLLTDLKTGETYRVNGTPDPHDEDHLEVMIVKNVGNTP